MVDLMSAIEDNKDLSEVTKKNYRERLAILCKRAGDKPLIEIVLQPTKYAPLFRRWHPPATSHKVSFTAILALFRYNPDLKEKNASAHEKWTAAFRDVDTKINERYETNKPTNKQIEGYVPFDEIIAKRDSLPQGHIHRLLLGMYTHIPPMRCEYARVAIYKDRLPSHPDENYILITSGGKKARLIIRHFKTRKFHDAMDKELPTPLVKDLSKSLEDEPRYWLFFDEKNQVPYTPVKFTQWTISVFKKLFDKPLTVSLIRHSFVNTIDMSKISIKEKKEIAEAMAHTVETQDRYRLLFDK
jgi:hypothetical protein